MNCVGASLLEERDEASAFALFVFLLEDRNLRPIFTDPASSPFLYEYIVHFEKVVRDRFWFPSQPYDPHPTTLTRTLTQTLTLALNSLH